MGSNSDYLCPYCDTPREPDDLECCDGTQIERLTGQVEVWRELYYSLFGLVRNEIRTTNTALGRIDNIETILSGSMILHRAVEDAIDKGV